MMSVAAFLSRYAKPVEPVITDPAEVSLDGLRGVVAYVDGDRTVWADYEGRIHLTLTKYLT